MKKRQFVEVWKKKNIQISILSLSNKLIFTKPLSSFCSEIQMKITFLL